MAFKVICYYHLSILIIQLWASYLGHYKKPNLFLSHYYFVGQFLFLSFFYKNIFKNDIKKNLVKLFLVLIPIFIIINYIIKPEEYFRFNLIEVIITSLPIIFYAFLYFLDTLDFTKKYIYFNSGVFIYLISSIFLFAVGNFITEAQVAKKFKSYVWIINNILYVIYQILIFIEWYKNFRKPSVKT